MAGYNGYSKSNNAIDAESNERYPLTKATKILAKKLNWTQQKARDFLKKNGTNEWHHTSKFFNIVDYYDVSDIAINELKEKIENFVFVKPEKTKTKYYFNCWNWDFACHDPRKLDWKISNVFTQNSRDIVKTKKILIEIKDRIISKHVAGHRTRERIYAENLTAIENILSALSKHKN